MRHRNRRLILSRQKGGSECHVLDVAATEFELARETIEIYIVVEYNFSGPDFFPNQTPAGVIRKWKMDGEGQSARERFVEVGFQIGCKYRETFILLHLLEEV